MSIDYEMISELVDVIADEKPLDWENINYDSVKSIAILNMMEKYHETMNDPQLSESGKEHTLVAVLSYLLLENTQLWIEREESKRNGI
jgi:hypothetical protein